MVVLYTGIFKAAALNHGHKPYARTTEWSSVLNLNTLIAIGVFPLMSRNYRLTPAKHFGSDKCMRNVGLNKQLKAALTLWDLACNHYDILTPYRPTDPTASTADAVDPATLQKLARECKKHGEYAIALCDEINDLFNDKKQFMPIVESIKRKLEDISMLRPLFSEPCAH